jgi:hypothetical protein
MQAVREVGDWRGTNGSSVADMQRPLHPREVRGGSMWACRSPPFESLPHSIA